MDDEKEICRINLTIEQSGDGRAKIAADINPVSRERATRESPLGCHFDAVRWATTKNPARVSIPRSPTC